MEPIVERELPVPPAQREPAGSEVEAAKALLAQLDAQARALGRSGAAAPVHYAMGRIFVEQLGDERSAAACYQNAFVVNPDYRPNLEAARRLFATAGRYEKALALHQREAALLKDPVPRAESLRAQALLLRELGRGGEAKKLLEEALQLAPEHPALLEASVEAAQREGDLLSCARLLVRAAGVTHDPVYRAQLLRRAVLLVERLQAGPGASPEAPAPEELALLHEEASRKLFQADPGDAVAFLGAVLRARQSDDWEAVLQLCRQRAERTGNAQDLWLVAAVAAHRLGRVSEGLAEAKAALEAHGGDGALLALQSELAGQQQSTELAALLRQQADGAVEAAARAHLRFSAAMRSSDPQERERLLSEALAENPADAATIALHARLVAQRDAAAGAARFVALGEALEPNAAAEAAAHYLEAGAWQERAGNREAAAALARRALKLVPLHGAALRLLTRTLPALGAREELVLLIEQSAPHLPRAQGAELLSRAAALLTESQPERAILLAQRAAEMARGLTGPRWLESWATFAFKAGDLSRQSQALEARADSTQGAEAAELLVEASELSRAVGDDARSTALLHKARGVDPQSAAARVALLALPGLPAAERVELLLEETRQSTKERAAALHAERAAVLELEGRADEAVQACGQALAIGGVDLAVLHRLAGLQVRRGDHAAALAVLVQIAEAVPEGSARSEAYCRAAELAEWRVGDARKAADLYRLAAQANPQAATAWAQLARILAWTGDHAGSARAYEQLASVAHSPQERNEARRWAASLYAHRAGQPGTAAALLRALVADAPGDLEATAELLALVAGGQDGDVRRERAELRRRLASRCQDPRVAAVLRAQSAQDSLAAGEREEGIAEYRRALALNPHDRVALDLVEEALRASDQKAQLAEHLGFRCAFADGETRAVLSLQQAEIFAGQGRLDEAAAAFRLALGSDPDSLLAVKGARRIAELQGDKEEALRLLAREAELARDPGLEAGSRMDAATLAAELGNSAEAVRHLTAVLSRDPSNEAAARALRSSLGEEAPRALADLYEKAAQDQADPRLSALAWTQAGNARLRELDDAEGALRAADRALSLDGDNAGALDLRADAAEACGRLREAADALQKRLALGGDAACQLRLGRLYAALGDAQRALPLLDDELASLEAPLLLRLAAGARELPRENAVRLYRLLLDVYPEPVDPAPTRAQLAEWADELARAHLDMGRREEALQEFRRAVALEPRNRSALRQVADLTAASAPEEAIAAHRALLDMALPALDSVHALVGLFDAAGRPDAAFCAAAALVGLGAAAPEERARHAAVAARPLPVELPQLADSAAMHATGDEGAARALLAAAALELQRALPTDLGAGRGLLVRGDNPVRRVVAAIARALGMGEPQIFLARSEPSVVAPVAGEAPGLLVGAEVPKRFTPRQQRFLFARALAHVRRGTQAVAGLPQQRLAALVGELIRLTAPAGTDLSRLPPADATLGEPLAQHVPQEARERLAQLAARAAAEFPTNWEPLALGIRESAERTGLAASGDPAAAIALVSAECQGGLERPEVARLVRFAVSEAYLALRPA